MAPARLLRSSCSSLVLLVQVTLGMAPGVAQLGELLRRAADRALCALERKEDFLRIRRHVQPAGFGHVATQIVQSHPPATA